MFRSAGSFNQNINSWNTAAVTDMANMFRSATAFNGNISSWNTAAVTNMYKMFNSATSFNQPLTHSGNSWNLGNVTNMSEMFSSAGLSIANYNIFLYSQANNAATNLNITITVSSNYSDTASRLFLTGTKNWTINDLGPVPNITNVTSTKTDGSYKQGDIIPVNVTFSEVVNVTGVPTLTLETGGTDAVVDYSSGIGTSTLTFNYTVLAGHTSADLDYTSTSSLGLPIPSPGTPVYKDTSGGVIGVTVVRNYAYMADRISGEAIIDISDPTSPGTPVYVDTSGSASGVTVVGNYAYVADYTSGLAIIDISNPASPGTPVYMDTSGFA